MREKGGEGGDMAFGAESLMHISAMQDPNRNGSVPVILKNHWTNVKRHISSFGRACASESLPQVSLVESS
jgi:hypothetical protein